MIAKNYVQEALQRTWSSDESSGSRSTDLTRDQSSIISKLIYDIYGGEILKTHKNKSWHFYNRIDGEDIDFTRSEMGKSSEDYIFEDLPSSLDEIHCYFAQEDYSTFLVRFSREFEYAVRTGKYQQGHQA